MFRRIIKREGVTNMGKDCCDIKVSKTKDGFQVNISGVNVENCDIEKCLKSCIEKNCCSDDCCK